MISVGSYDGVVAGWDSRNNPKLLANIKPPKKKDDRLSPTRDLPPTPSSTPLPLSFAIANHEGSVKVVSSSRSGLMFSCGSGEKARGKRFVEPHPLLNHILYCATSLLTRAPTHPR